MRLAVNDTELYFDVEGAGLVPEGPAMRRRPSVVLLHGGPGFDHSYFKPSLSALAGDAQLVYLDHRGNGRSGRPPLETCTVVQMADDVAALCRTLDLQRPVLLGHSYGGFVALHAALRHPGLLGGLILVSSAAAGDDTGEDEGIDALERLHGADARAAVDRLFGGGLSEDDLTALVPRLLTTYVRDRSRAGLMTEVATRTILATDMLTYYMEHYAGTHDVRARLGEIRLPTLVVVGEDDWITSPGASRALASGIPQADLEVVPDAGHMVFMEQPERFCAVVRRFLARPAIATP